jgi:hypothetical protein
MKTTSRLIFLLLAVFLSGKAMSQGTSVTVFTENGEKFTLFVNGEQKNSKPADHAMADNLWGPNFKVRIVFKDMSLREVEKTIMNHPNTSLFYVLRIGKKGDYMLEKTTSDYIHHGETVKEEEAPPPPPPAHEKQAEHKSESSSKKPGGGCKSPMPEGDFQASIAVISNAPFEGPKTSNAKKLVEGHCLTCDQIREVMYVVSYESSRLSIAKAAYTHCFDPANYDEVRNVLNSNKSKEELDAYIASMK